MKKIMIAAVAAVCVVGTTFGFDGIIGETFKGVGYCLFGDNIHPRVTVVNAAPAYVAPTYATTVVHPQQAVAYAQVGGYPTAMYGYTPTAAAYAPVRPAYVPPTYYVPQPITCGSAPVQQTYSNAQQAAPQRQGVSLTQIAKPTQVKVPSRVVNYTTTEGVNLDITVREHTIETY